MSFSTTKCRWLKKWQALHVQIRKLEIELSKALEQLQQLKAKATSLALEAREYRGRWLSDARVLDAMSRYLSEDDLDVLLSSQARDDICSSPYRDRG